MSKSDLLSLDCFATTRDEAVEHTVHHLRLAIVFFMNTPDGDGGAQLKEELRRVFERSQEGFWEEHLKACEAWVDVMVGTYEDDKEANP